MSGRRVERWKQRGAIPIPLARTTVFEVALSITLSVAAAFPAPQDTVRRLERAASSAAFHYESLLRRRAPERLGGGFGGECDEIVGRFCFRFGSDDTPDPPPEPEHPDVRDARTRAVVAHRRWFAADPADSEAAGALLRYLVDADRAREAVSAARTHAWAAGRTPESLLLLGLALHEAAEFVEAEAVFDSARADLPEERRRELDSIEKLLEPDERKGYRQLDDDARARFESRFWAFSDPSFIDPGNERRSAHYARHAWAAILAEAPRANGMISWGSDHEEILIRYGLPVSRERVRRPVVTLETRLNMIESYDPHAVALVPAWLLTRGMPPIPEPGVRHEMERDTARAGYAPVRRHRLRGLDAQVALFPTASGSILRVDAVLPPDTVSPVAPRRPQGRLVVLDTLARERARVPAAARVREDSATVLSAETELPPGSWVYRIEVVDRDSTDHAGLSQYRLDVPPPEGLRVSDLLVAADVAGEPPTTRQDPRLSASPDLVLRTGQAVLLYAEVAGLERIGETARYGIEWWIEDAEPGSLLGRAVGWVGRQLGLASEDEPTRVRWEDISTDTPVPVAFTLDLAGAEAGLHRIGLTVRDRVSGESRTVRRLIRLDPSAPPLPAPPDPPSPAGR